MEKNSLSTAAITTDSNSIMLRCVHELVHHQLPRPLQGYRHLRPGPGRCMVFILDGNSEIGARVRIGLFKKLH